MNRIVVRYWPLLLVVVVYGAVVVAVASTSVRENGGHLVYALDDPYIHLCMAKNLAEHGVWGVTRYVFSSSSSSLLWTLLLSRVFFCLGTNDLVPFILNILLAIALLAAVSHFLRRYAPGRSLLQFLALLAVAFVTPLPSLVFTGQEHVAHAVLTICFVACSAKALCSEDPLSGRAALLVMAPLLTMVRYEGMFLIGILCFLLVLRRRWAFAVSLGVLAAAPLVIYGLISLSNGWFFVPNSILLKANVPWWTAPGIHQFLSRIQYELTSSSSLHAILGVGLFLLVLQLWKHRTFWSESAVMLSMLLAAALLHLLFARTGWLYRYEAYLGSLGIVAIATAVPDFLPAGFRALFRRRDVPKLLAVVLPNRFVHAAVLCGPGGCCERCRRDELPC